MRIRYISSKIGSFISYFGPTIKGSIDFSGLQLKSFRLICVCLSCDPSSRPKKKAVIPPTSNPTIKNHPQSQITVQPNDLTKIEMGEMWSTAGEKARLSPSSLLSNGNKQEEPWDWWELTHFQLWSHLTTTPPIRCLFVW